MKRLHFRENQNFHLPIVLIRPSMKDLIKQVENVNLLYHEATFDNTMEEMAIDKQHSTSEQAARLAKQSNVGRLLLGHFSARFENLSALLAQAQSIFPKTLLSEEGKSYEIGS